MTKADLIDEVSRLAELTRKDSEVIVETSIGEVASVITTRSVQEMKLKGGDKVFALVKATNVSLRRRS